LYVAVVDNETVGEPIPICTATRVKLFALDATEFSCGRDALAHCALRRILWACVGSVLKNITKREGEAPAEPQPELVLQLRLGRSLALPLFDRLLTPFTGFSVRAVIGPAFHAGF
jgi:hypothetical protein